MPIPERLAHRQPSDTEVRTFSELCHEIEVRVVRQGEADDLLAQWNARANRVFEDGEFTTYSSAMDTVDFVKIALAPVPSFVPDLTYAELRAVFEGVMNFTAGGLAAHSYYLRWLEAQFPDSNVSDLIYHTDSWFGVPAALQFPFTADQLLRAAIEFSGRTIPGAPVVSLPFELPKRRQVLITPAPSR